MIFHVVEKTYKLHGALFRTIWGLQKWMGIKLYKSKKKKLNKILST